MSEGSILTIGSQFRVRRSGSLNGLSGFLICSPCLLPGSAPLRFGPFVTDCDMFVRMTDCEEHVSCRRP